MHRGMLPSPGVRPNLSWGALSTDSGLWSPRDPVSGARAANSVSGGCGVEERDRLPVSHGERKAGAAQPVRALWRLAMEVADPREKPWGWFKFLGGR